MNGEYYVNYPTRGKKEWARQDSNLRPDGYEPPALPLSYEPVERRRNSSCYNLLGEHKG